MYAGDPPARGGIILLGTFAATSGLNYAFGVALAWALAPSQYGVVGVIQAVLLFAAMLLNSGFPWTLARAIARQRRLGAVEVSRVMRTSLVGNVLLALVLGSVILALHARDTLRLGDALTGLVIVAVVTLPFFALNAVLRGALHGSLRFGSLGLMKTSEVFLKVGVGLALVYVAGFGVHGVALAFLVGAAGATVLGLWLARDCLPGLGRLAPLAAYVETAPMFAGTFAFAAMIAIDLISLKAIGPGTALAAAQIGLYQVASMLARLPYFVGDAVMDAAYPHIARRHESAFHSDGYFRAAARWLLIAVLPVELILLVAPTPILALFFPSSYAAAAELLRILAAGSFGALAAVAFGKSLQAIGRAGIAAVGILCGLAVELAVIVVAVPHHGGVAAAGGFAAGSWCAAGLLAVAYQRRQRTPLPRPSAIGRYLLALLVAVPSLMWADGMGPIAGLIAIIGAVMLYSLALRALDIVRLAEFRRFASLAAGMAQGRRG